MKGVILAAGYGDRLRPLSLETPKILLEVAGLPLIHYPLHALRSAGIEDIAIIVGHRADKIIWAFETWDILPTDITFIINPNYKGGNALSVEATQSFTGKEPFVLCMGDHIISTKIVSSLLVDGLAKCTLCVDYKPSYSFQSNDATRVRIGPFGEVAEIGKHLKTWNAVDTGVFLLTSHVFDTIRHLREQQGLEVELSHVVQSFAGQQQPFSTCDVSGCFWTDTDTLEDYLAINKLMSAGMVGFSAPVALTEDNLTREAL